jgi:hypothetical protein
MEIVEVVYYFVDDFTNTLEVEFRLSEDSDDDIRIDKINLSEVEELGIPLNFEEDDFYEYDEDEEDDLEQEYSRGDIQIDGQELLSFLNEYYTINPDRLPHLDV